jgi:hypothetical protein
VTDEPAVRVEHACRHLLTTGAAITFDAVAAHTGIGRDALTLTGLQVQIDQLRLALEAVAAKTGRHEEELRKLHLSNRAE